MGQVLIRNLDDAMIADYRRAAKDKGRSLEAELRDALAQSRPRAARPSREVLLALSEKLWAATPSAAAAVDSTPFIRSMRDET